MPSKYATRNGSFHDTGVNSLWYSASAANAPGGYVQVEPPVAGDDAISNGYFVTITNDIRCNNLHNGRRYGFANPGGGFVLNTWTNSVSVTANVLGTKLINNTTALSCVGTNTATLVGFVRAPECPTPNSLGSNYGVSVVNRNTNTFNMFGEITSPDIIGSDLNGGNAFVHSASGTLNLYGNIRSSNLSRSYWHDRYIRLLTLNSGTFNLYGHIITTGGWSGIDNMSLVVSGPSTTTIFGNIYGNDTNGDALYPVNINSSTGPVTMTVNGNVYAGVTQSGAAIYSANPPANTTLTVNGNLISGRNGYCVDFRGTNVGTIRVNGNILTQTAVGIHYTNSNVFVNGNVVTTNIEPAIYGTPDNTGVTTINGNLLGTPQGIPAIQAPFVRFASNVYQPYISHAKTPWEQDPNVSQNKFADVQTYYTLDALSEFSLPPISSVRAGHVYANSLYTGTCQIPLTSDVYYGVRYDADGTVMGTATVNPIDFFLINPAALLVQNNTLGQKLANAATIDVFGNTVASLG
jgi:hypothetical protein